MKKSLILCILISVLFACSQEVKKSTEDSLPEKDNIVSSENKNDNDSLLVNDTVHVQKLDTNSDWYKMNLKDSVKYFSTSTKNYSIYSGELSAMTSYWESYEFNKNGYITVHRKDLGMDGEMRITYKYADGVLTHRVFEKDEDGDGSVIEFDHKEKYFYNSKNQLVKIKKAGEDQKLFEEISFKYNKDGKIKTETKSDLLENEVEVTSYSYDGLKLTKSITDIEGEVLRTRTEIKDANGDVVRREFKYDEEEQQTKYNYKFKVDSNWVSSITEVRDLEDGKMGEWRKSSFNERVIKMW